MDKCPNCKSKRINEVPGCEDTQYINTYYCMKCEKEFDYKGKELAPIYVEFKFRAMPRYTNMCQDELKEMPQYDGTFIYGHLIDNYIVGDAIEATDEYISLEYWVPIKKETMGQYTGLKDKNGTEIYEGDIVEFRPWNGEETENYIVKFISGDASFRGIKKYKSSTKVLSLINSEQGLKVIGNKYEHPEILEGIR